jgi:hypothetical protein
VPVSVRVEGQSQPGNRVSSYFVDLPVGEGNPVMRLHQVSFAMRGHKESGESVGADALVQLSGFAPPTLHSLGAPRRERLHPPLFNLVVTNVPGPAVPALRGGRAHARDVPRGAAREGAGGGDRPDVVRRRRLLRPERRPRRHARHRRCSPAASRSHSAELVGTVR